VPVASAVPSGQVLEVLSLSRAALLLLLRAVVVVKRVSGRPVSVWTAGCAALQGGAWWGVHHATMFSEAHLWSDLARTAPAGDDDGLHRAHRVSKTCSRIHTGRVLTPTGCPGVDPQRKRDLTSSRVMQPRYIDTVNVLHGGCSGVDGCLHGGHCESVYRGDAMRVRVGVVCAQ
jgi:hypothetical protein